MQCIIGNNNTHSNEYFGCAFTPGDICQQFTREMFDLYQGYALYRNWAFDLLNYTHAEHGKTPTPSPPALPTRQTRGTFMYKIKVWKVFSLNTSVLGLCLSLSLSVSLSLTLSDSVSVSQHLKAKVLVEMELK